MVVYPRHLTGLGDILARFLSGVAAAHATGCTLVLMEPVWNIPNGHEKTGYNISIFENTLGVPIRDFPLKQKVIEIFKPTMLPEMGADRFLFGAADYHASMPCNSMTTLISGYGCKRPNTWCFEAIGSTIQTVIRPFLDESIQLQHVPPQLPPPLLKNKLNIVWHLRSGKELCLHCAEKDKLFYNRIFKFIEGAVKLEPGIEYQNIFVHLPDARLAPLLVDIPNQVHYTNDNDVDAVVKMFMQSDVLVTTGSSFPNIVSYFTPLYKPVVIEALDKDSDIGYVRNQAKVNAVIDNYAIIDGRSFRLDIEGNVLHFKSDDLLFRLQVNGAIKRIKSASSN
jgi:hypothetical protein